MNECGGVEVEMMSESELYRGELTHTLLMPDYVRIRTYLIGSLIPKNYCALILVEHIHILTCTTILHNIHIFYRIYSQ